MNNNLSVIEQEFVSVMSRMECITTEQAKYILHKVLKCSENQAKKVLESLIIKTFISCTEDNTYVMIGSKKNKYSGKINRDVIKAMYYYLDHVQDAEELKLIHKPQAGQTCMVFTKEQKLYEVIPVSLESLYKINLAQETYKERIKEFDRNKIKVDEFMPITVFIFNASDNEATILEKMDAINISMPHIVVIPQNDGIEKWMKYTEYRC